MQFAAAQDAPACTFEFSKIVSPYTVSTFNIAMFQGTLPPSVTREYALRPFSIDSYNQTFCTWTTQTTLYDVELRCEVINGPTTRVPEHPIQNYSLYTYSVTYSSQQLLLARFSVHSATNYGLSQTFRCDTSEYYVFASLARLNRGTLNRDNDTYNATALFCHAD
jgi:hypothetical protein